MLKLKLAAFILLMLFIFPQRVQAGEREFIARFKTEDGASLLRYDDIYFASEFSEEERAWVVFHNLLCSGESEFVPIGVNLLGVNIVQGELLVNVSPQIKNYGGTYNERHLRAQIVLTGLEMRGVELITLLIDGVPGVLAEGSSIERIGEWDELMD